MYAQRYGLLAGGACLLMTLACTAQAPAPGSAGSLRIEVTAAPGLISTPSDGRLFVVLGKEADPEPRLGIGRTGLDRPPVVARDVSAWDGSTAAVLDGTAVAFPVASLDAVPDGDYVAQALLDTNVDLKSVNAPGNLYSAPTPVTITRGSGAVVHLDLTARVPDETLPPETDYLRFVKIQSEKLTAFHGRPIYLRAGIILPRGYADEPTRTYPLRVRIGGYGASYTRVQRMMADDSEFRKAWLADDAPRFVLLHLDGDGPLGDPYQVNSDNHGPYGDAITEELIPYVEREFRGIGEPRTRVLDGGSTGGWVSLALQVFYPDFFNGTWSSCPDGVDFRGFQLVNIYEDDNAYVNTHGFERPSAREVTGDVRFTMRHEVSMENVLGRHDSWALSGGQWGAWNATYGPRGADGLPVPLWDPVTGAIDRSVTDHWKRYDLRMYVEDHWSELAPRLRGKIRVFMGDADSYFLNNAARMLETFFAGATPGYGGRMVFAPGEGHCWVGMDDRAMLAEMGRVTGARP
ncbi:MAG: alpha/beta hydrolase-fold protein [Vicinamibacterales bacterium]